MDDMRGTGLSVGEVADRTGLTVRTLHYYEEMGLLAPSRDTGGRRRYDAEMLQRLTRIRLLRQLGVPVADLDPDSGDLAHVARRALDQLDRDLLRQQQVRDRIHRLIERLGRADEPRESELLDLLAGLDGPESTPSRRITLLVYRDLVAARDFLTDVFGLRAGATTIDDEARVVHVELYAGDGVLWLHPEHEEFGLASPASVGRSTCCMAVEVSDVEAHCARVRELGAEIVYDPVDMPYGVREYAARDSEGGWWSFMQPFSD